MPLGTATVFLKNFTIREGWSLLSFAPPLETISSSALCQSVCEPVSPGYCTGRPTGSRVPGTAGHKDHRNSSLKSSELCRYQALTGYTYHTCRHLPIFRPPSARIVWSRALLYVGTGYLNSGVHAYISSAKPSSLPEC